MPAAIPFVPLMAAGAVATGQFIASKIGSHDAQKARDAQQKASDAALGYEKGRDAIGDQRYDQKFKLYQDYLNDYRARHGGTPGTPGATGATGGGGGSPMPVSVSDLVQSQQGAAGAQGSDSQPQPGSVGDMVNGGDVFDWRRYGA